MLNVSQDILPGRTGSKDSLITPSSPLMEVLLSLLIRQELHAWGWAFMEDFWGSFRTELDTHHRRVSCWMWVTRLVLSFRSASSKESGGCVLDHPSVCHTCPLKNIPEESQTSWVPISVGTGQLSSALARLSISHRWGLWHLLVMESGFPLGRDSSQTLNPISHPHLCLSVCQPESSTFRILINEIYLLTLISMNDFPFFSNLFSMKEYRSYW